MSRFRKGLVALFVTLAMALCVAVPAFAEPDAESSTDASTEMTQTDGGVTVDKTATELKDDQTTVTLAVGADQSLTGSDVVFVLDKSASLDIRNEAMNMLRDLMEQATEGNLIKVGVVNFETGVLSSLELTELTDENFSTIEEAVTYQNENSSGTNIYAGLVAGKQMLDNDSGVDNANKHLVLVTDGVTYLWGTDAEGVESIYSEKISTGEECLYASHETIDWHHAGSSYYDEFLDMKTWLNTHGDAIADDMSQYGVQYDRGQYKAKDYGVESGRGEATDWSVISKFAEEDSYVPYEMESETASAADAALYMVATEWSEIAEKYDVRAYADPRYSKNGKYVWAYNAISNLSDLGGESGALPESIEEYKGMFKDVESSVLYDIQSGIVSDVIGSDFDLVSVDSFTLTIGGEPAVNKTVEDNTVIFNDGDYVVEYHSAGQDGEEEGFAWTINVPVKTGEALELSYELSLVNKSAEPGTHDVPTNESAVLNYKDTDGSEGNKPFPVPTVSYTVYESQDGWDTSKSKTATNLDDNFESKVTLSLPSAQENLSSDIVFVVDKSTSSRAESTTKGIDLLENLAASLENTNATLKVGIVVFDGTSHIMRELESYDAGDVSEKMNAGIPEDEAMSGTNMEAGLMAAQNMLSSDKDVSDGRKHVIVISDGLTRLFSDVNGDTQIIFNGVSSDGTIYLGDMTTWCLSNGLADGTYNIPAGYSSWIDYYQKVIKLQVEADGDQYVVSFTGESKLDKEPDKYIPLDEVDKHAQSVDRAFYDAYNAYENMSKQYHCYAVFTGNSELGRSFMDALNKGANVDFNSIYDGIYYLLDAGSKVVDVIGRGTDNHGNDYDFKFVDKANKLTLTVGDASFEAVDVSENIDSSDQFATSRYVFGAYDEESKSYPYVLTYYENGQDGKSDECFVWEINVPVTNFAPVQLTYSVQLVNPQDTAGTYGQYDEDGSEGYTSLYTNKSATLFPVDSNGEKGEAEEFLKPTVSYTVEKPSTPGGGGGGGEEPKPEPEPEPEPTPEPEKPGPTDPVNPGADKDLVDAEGNELDLVAGQFAFQLTGQNGAPMPEDAVDGVSTATNRADGTIVFDDITFDKAGTYTYTLTEVLPEDDDAETDGVQSNGVTYDQSSHTLTIVVSDKDSDGDGKLDITSLLYDGEASLPTFTNVGEPEEPAEPEPEPEEPSTPQQPTQPVTPSTPGPDLPQTGDYAVLTVGVVALVGAAAAGTGVVLKRRRK